MTMRDRYGNTKLRYTNNMNTYYGLRHGESEANVKGLVVSLPVNGLNEFGLTALGKVQVITSCGSQDLNQPIIISSDFKRTIETAYIAAAHYHVNFRVSPLLRERSFKAFEFQSNAHYHTVWQYDHIGRPYPGVETTASVARRCNKLIMQLEEKHQNRSIILVSHGDTLQIMQCVLTSLPHTAHRKLNHLMPGELRILS